MPRPIRNLTDMEIDEISTVDKAANQYSRFVIAKRAPEEEEMPQLYNQEGQPLDEDQLEFGDIVYDDEGTAYEYVEDDDEDAAENEDENELQEVGKARVFRFSPGTANNGRFGSTAEEAARAFGSGGARHKVSQAAGKVFGQGRTARNRKIGAGIGAGGAGAAAAGGYGHKKLSKSFSEEVMEELSKAFSDNDRDEIIAKALGRVEELESAQQEAFEIAKSERDLRLTREYISKAAEYNLPVDPEVLGPVLYRMADTMSFEDCKVIAKCLETAGEILFEETGYTGGGDNADIYSQVEKHAYDTFGKAEDFNSVSAINQVFDQNPDAYDEYLAAQRNR